MNFCLRHSNLDIKNDNSSWSRSLSREHSKQSPPVTRCSTGGKGIPAGSKNDADSAFLYSKSMTKPLLVFDEHEGSLNVFR